MVALTYSEGSLEHEVQAQLYAGRLLLSPASCDQERDKPLGLATDVCGRARTDKNSK